MPLPIALFLLAAGAAARWYGQSRSLEEGTKAQLVVPLGPDA